MVEKWLADFKRGRTSTDDAERSGRPNSAVVPENKKSPQISADRKLKLRQRAEILEISEGSVFTILYEHLSMEKLCSEWVSCLLTVDQKQQRVDDSERCRKLAVGWVDTEGWKPSKATKNAMSAGKVFKMLEKRWDVFITLEVVDEWSRISPESLFLLLILRTYWVTYYAREGDR